MFLILDISSDARWSPPVVQGHPDGLKNAKRIPQEHRPTVLQLGSEAEVRAEVERLLQVAPHRTYAVFRCIGTAVTMNVPWAVTGAGEVLSEARVPKWVSP